MFVYCSECEYWIENDFTPENGQCRRHAPSPVRLSGESFINAGNNRAVWMFTRINDGCGEGQVAQKERKRISDLTKDQSVKLETKAEINSFEAAVQKARRDIKNA